MTPGQDVLLPLYIGEVLITMAALMLGVICFRKRTPGWEQVPIIFPWLTAKAVYASLLLTGLVPHNMVADFLIWIAGPMSIVILFAVRLWKHG